MFGSDWVKHAAIGLAAGLLLFAPVLGALAAKNGEQYEARSNQAGDTPAPEPRGAVKPSNSNAGADEERDAGQRQSQHASTPRYWFFGDSLAQWGMAAITGVATALLWLTLIQTKRMLKEAEATAQAARDTVRVTRDIGQKQVRAYLGVRNVSVVFPDVAEMGRLRANGKAVNPHFFFQFANSGQSPARAIRYCTEAAFMALASTKPGHAVATQIGPQTFKPIEGRTEGGYLSVEAVSAGESLDREVVVGVGGTEPFKVLERAEDGSRVVITFLVQAEYLDVFEQKTTDRWCFYGEVLAPSSGEAASMQPHPVEMFGFNPPDEPES